MEKANVEGIAQPGKAVDAFLAEVKNNYKGLPLNGLFELSTEESSEEAIRTALMSDWDILMDEIREILAHRLEAYGILCIKVTTDAAEGLVTARISEEVGPIEQFVGNALKVEFLEAPSYREVMPLLVQIDALTKENNWVRIDSSLLGLESTETDDFLAELSGDPNASGGKDLEIQIAEFRAERPFSGLFDVEVPLNPENCVVGYASAQNRPQIDAVLQKVPDSLMGDLELIWMSKANVDMMDMEGKELYELVAVDRGPKWGLGNASIESAYVDQTNYGGVAIFFQFNEKGSEIWAEMTQANTGKCIAMVGPTGVYSAPRVSGAITGGRSQIDGNFTVEEAEELAQQLDKPMLPVTLKLLGAQH